MGLILGSLAPLPSALPLESLLTTLSCFLEVSEQGLPGPVVPRPLLETHPLRLRLLWARCGEGRGLGAMWREAWTWIFGPDWGLVKGH